MPVAALHSSRPAHAGPSADAARPYDAVDAARQALSNLQRRLTPDAQGLRPMRIDWQAGVAELVDKTGETRSLLRVSPARDDSPASLEATAESLKELADISGRLIACNPTRTESDPSRWPFPTEVMLDGFVLRADGLVQGILAQEPDAQGERWRMQPDVREFGFLCNQPQWSRTSQEGRTTRRGGHDFRGPPLPTLASNRAPAVRTPGRFDETWVMQVGGDGDLAVATLLANSRREKVRLFTIDPVPGSTDNPHWLREIPPREILNGWDEVDKVPLKASMADLPQRPSLKEKRPDKSRSDARSPTPDGAPGTVRDDSASRVDVPRVNAVVRPRVMVVGDSRRDAGDPEPRAGLYDGESLAHLIKHVADTVAARAGAPVQPPQHVSIVSSHQQSGAFRHGPSAAPAPSFGERFLTTITEAFDDPSITASLRTDGYRVGFHHPHSEEHEGRRFDLNLDVDKAPVYVADPTLDGRKFVRASASDARYLNKAPGGTVVLSRLEDGTIRQVDKYPDFGQGHVADTTQRTPQRFIDWLSTPGPTQPPSAGLPPADRFMMGEVIIDRALLSRMGLRDTGQDLGAAGAYLHLRFTPDTLEALLRGGEPAERVAALRLLKQMMRDGVSAEDILRPATDSDVAVPAREAGAMAIRLRELSRSLDNALLLSTLVWNSLWGERQDRPPLPRSVAAKGFDPI